MYDALKYELRKQYMRRKHLDILAIQEPHGKVIDSFISEDFAFFFSGNAKETHSGCGFVIRKELLKYVTVFLPISDRISIQKFVRPDDLYGCFPVILPP